MPSTPSSTTTSGSQSGGLDRRDKTTLGWDFPFGFLDQGFSSPIRLPTPAGDYCYVFDIENREPADTRPLRTLDSDYCRRSLPPPWDIPVAHSFGVPKSPVPPARWRLEMFPSTPDYNQHMFAYLHAWRQFLEQWAAMTAGFPFPTAPFAWPTVPFMPAGGQFMPPTAPFMPPMPPFAPPTPAAPAPPATLGPPAPADYTQQLFGYLQAWRQYLEQMADAIGIGARAAVGRGEPPRRRHRQGIQPTVAAAAAGGHPAREPWREPSRRRRLRPSGTASGFAAHQRRIPERIPASWLRSTEPLRLWPRSDAAGESTRLRLRVSRPLQRGNRPDGHGRLHSRARSLERYIGGSRPASSGFAIFRRNGARRAHCVAASRAEIAFHQSERARGVGKD